MPGNYPDEVMQQLCYHVLDNEAGGNNRMKHLDKSNWFDSKIPTVLSTSIFPVCQSTQFCFTLVHLFSLSNTTLCSCYYSSLT